MKFYKLECDKPTEIEQPKIYNWKEICETEGIYAPQGRDIYIVVVKSDTVTNRYNYIYIHKTDKEIRVVPQDHCWDTYKFTIVDKKLYLDIQ